MTMGDCMSENTGETRVFGGGKRGLCEAKFWRQREIGGRGEGCRNVAWSCLWEGGHRAGVGSWVGR